MTITVTKDEREILTRLCDDLATRHAPLYKSAHLLIKSALNAPAKPDAATRLIERLVFLSGNELPTTTQWHDLTTAANLLIK